MKYTQSDCAWYVVYTYPKAERKVCDRLNEVGINSFLPLHKVVRQWSDRKKKIEVPLFPNYVFVYIALQGQYEVLSVKEIVRFISFEGKPTVVPEIEIESLKSILTSNVEIYKECSYKPGTPVKVVSGTFSGVIGTFVREDSKCRLLVQVKALNQTISVSLPIDCITEVAC